MRKILFGLSLMLLTSVASSAPTLVVLEKKDASKAIEHLTILRETNKVVFAVTDALPQIETQCIPKVIDAAYQAGQFFLIPLKEAQATGRQILWSDNRQALVRLFAPETEWNEFHVPLELTLGIVRESRPPAHLDDPALDAWLTQIFNQTNGDSMMAYVTSLAGFNRYTRWTSNDNAAYWIRDKFASFGIDSVYLHSFTASGSGWSRTVNNVVAVIPGVDSPDSIVIIGGHMDATSPSPSAGAPGADDNASGTAAVIEAARLLSPYQFHHTLMFAAFNGEEQGLLGSEALAAQMQSQDLNVIALLNLDMISYYDASGSDVWIEGFYQGTSSLWLMEAIEDDYLQFSTLIPEIYGGEGYGSDHVPFHDQGYPAVLSIEYEYNGNSCYHQLCDLPARVDIPFMRQIGATNIVTMAELAVPLGSGSISGTVALQGATDFSGVQVRMIGGIGSDTTGSDGAYHITGLMPGTHSLEFAHAGWVTDTLIGIVVTDGNETTNQNIILQNAIPGSIAGTISLVGGSGVLSDAIVYTSGSMMRVNVDGTYLLSPLYVGQQVIMATLAGYAMGSQTITLGDGENRTGVNFSLYPIWNLEASNYGLTENGTGWQWGVDATAGAHSGTNVWGTVLGANYANCTDYQLVMPAMCLANLDSAKLIFWHWYDIEPNGATTDYDGANVSVAPYGTGNWEVIAPVGGYPGGAGYNCNPIQNEPAYAGASGAWLQAAFNLSAYLGQTISIRFRLGGVTRRGWYLDDLAVYGWLTTTPDAVDDLVILPVGDNIFLYWSAKPGALQYGVYRGDSSELPTSEMTRLGTVTTPEYTDETAGDLTIAFYRVVAER
jgi:hypothetical protein